MSGYRQPAHHGVRNTKILQSLRDLFQRLIDRPFAHEEPTRFPYGSATAPAHYFLKGDHRTSIIAYAASSRIAFFTLVGTSAYFMGSITDDARPVLIERSSVV